MNNEKFEMIKEFENYIHQRSWEDKTGIQVVPVEEAMCAVRKTLREHLNQKTGHWIDYGAKYDVRCSICNTQCPLKPISSSRLMVCKSDYCPGCGAKMKGE